MPATPRPPRRQTLDVHDPKRSTDVEAAAVATIWARPERAGRGPKPAHTRDEITSVAIRIADDEGIDAVSMRRVAQELGAGTTSLYRYFSKKTELFELMADAVVGELPLTARSGEWSSDLRAVAVRERLQLQRHPWYLTIQGARPLLGPNNLRVMDHSLSTVEDLGLDIDGMLVMVSTVIALVHGYVMNELSDLEATRLMGRDADEWMEAIGPYAQAIVDSGEYPRVARTMLDAVGPHAPDRAERAFTLGLDRLLDGLAASLSGFGGQRPILPAADD
ncbi:MAG: TetR/AcrR family transcriptional regulator [Aquihabitans sp.]